MLTNKKLTEAKRQIDYAIEDLSHDEHEGALAHADIARRILTEICNAAGEERALAMMPDAEDSEPCDPLRGERIDSADMGEC